MKKVNPQTVEAFLVGAENGPFRVMACPSGLISVVGTLHRNYDPTGEWIVKVEFDSGIYVVFDSSDITHVRTNEDGTPTAYLK